MASTYSLTLRGDLDRKLTIEEMDNNFLYLQENGGGSITGNPSEVLYFDTNGYVTSDSSFIRGTNSTHIELYTGTTSHYIHQSNDILGFTGVDGTAIISIKDDAQAAIAVVNSNGLFQNLDLLAEIVYSDNDVLSIVTTNKLGTTIYYQGSTESQLKVSEKVSIDTTTFSMNGNDGFSGTVYSPITSITCVNGIVTDIQYGCLLGNSKIELFNGSYKEIKFILPDDVLLSYNTITKGKTSVVVREIQMFRSVVVDINSGLLISSPSHNHYIKRGGNWVVQKTGELIIGDILMDINNNEIEINSMVYSEGLFDVYNIVVSGNHLYYANGILTHNKP